MRQILIILIISISSITIAQSQDAMQISNGEDLIRLIYKTHSPNWYKHLTFKQNIYSYRADTLIRNEVWLVAYSASSKLHIRYVDFDSGRGWMLANDTLYSFNHNKLIGEKFRLHEQIILGFDLFSIPPDEIIPRIKSMSIDLSVLSTLSINGKQVYQVGDPTQHCFWVKMDDLLLYGIRKVSENNVSDTYFENYKTFYGKPVATEMQYFRNGKMYRYEKYSEIRLPTSLPVEFFYPNLFEETRW